MTYSQLLSDLTALNLHPLAETNVHAVTQDRGAAFLDFDTSAEQQELEGLRDEAQAWQRHCESADAALDQANSDLEKANALLDEIKGEEPDEKGRTLRQYIEDAELQARQAAAWRGEAEKYKAELLALRKRKGVTCNFVREQTNTLNLLNSINQYQSNGKLTEQQTLDLRALLVRIYAK